MLPLNRSRNRSRFFGLAVPQSALDLDFLSGTLDPRITFTRASSGTFFGSNGLLQTASNDVPRFDYDPVTLAARGLLIEEQRTNLLTWSENFGDAVWVKTSLSVTTNAAVAPDGASNADKQIPNTGAAGSYLAQGFSATSGTTYTYTIYAKAAEFSELRLLGESGAFGSNQVGIFNLLTGIASIGAGSPIVSMLSVGNGWWRCVWTATATATTTAVVQQRIAVVGDGNSGILVWGAQLEVGAFPTSYIPTTSATATRAADLASMTGTNFSSWFNATQGVIYSEASFISPLSTGTNARVFEISDTTINERMTVLASSSLNAMRFAVIDNNTSQASLIDAAIPLVARATYKIAASYQQDNFGFSVNGNSVSVDTSGTVPNVTTLNLGRRFDGTTDYANGWLRRIVYWPISLPNAQLQIITA